MTKFHSIIKNPHTHEIKNLIYNCESSNLAKHYIDLRLKKDKDIRNLRFIAPQQLKIEEGFPMSTSGMEILELSKDQLDGVRAQVRNFEANHGSITFYAKHIVDLNDLET